MNDIKVELAKPRRTRISNGRSKRGCFECRERHLKCNEDKPVCGRCSAKTRSCTWPTFERAYVPEETGEKKRPATGPATAITTLSSSKTSGSRSLQDFVVHQSLGNPNRDPDGIFEHMGATHMQTLDSLIFWLTLRTEMTPAGFAGNMTPTWISLIQKCCYDEPAVVCLFSVNALKLQESLIGASMRTSVVRGQLYAIKRLQQSTSVTASMLMVVMLLGGIAGHEGDIASAKAHFDAVMRLYRPGIKMTLQEWVFLFGTCIMTATMIRNVPFLPWIPPVLSRNIAKVIPSTDMSRLNRLASSNAIAVLKLAEDNYLRVTGILRDLHIIYHIRQKKLLPGTELSIHVDTISLCYRTHEMLLQAKKTTVESDDPSDICRELLALALQACVWRFIMPDCSKEELYDGDHDTFPSVPKVTNDDACALLERIGGAEKLMELWGSIATAESFVWVCYTLTLDLNSDNIKAVSPWNTILTDAVHALGIYTRGSLRKLLHKWPCSHAQVEAVTRQFEESPTFSGQLLVET